MGKENKNNTKLGLFVTIAILLFTVGVYYMGNKQNIFGSSYKISSIFENVKGLTIGNNVRYSGISIGTVGDIIILNDSMIQVDMMLENKMQAFLKKDAVATIGSDGLVGNMIVNISPGEGTGQSAEYGDVINSFARLETGEMINSLGNTTENIALLTMNLLEIAENINSGEGSVASLLNDPTMANDLSLAIKNLKITTQNINALTGQFQKNMNEVNQGEGLLGYLFKDSTFEYQINHITEGLDTLIRSRTTPIMENLEASSKDIAMVSADLKKIIQEIDLQEGLAGAILKDSLTAEDFKQTMENLSQGTDRFNENMEALKHNFLFRKYFKKQEKKRQKELKKQADAVVHR